MKSKLLNAFSLLRLSMIAALAMFCVSCDETETTDSTGFILHYYGVTDIGPSMSYSLQAPTYKGSAPYDFTITKVTLDDETFNNEENFVIDAETGAITIQNTAAMAAGLYNISVGCHSNGKFFEFKDAVQVNMLLAVPEGVTVEPAEVTVNLDEENWAASSAQVTTEKDKHVTITGYSIAQDETKPYLSWFTFDPNNEGKIIIRESEKDKLVAGESYTLSLKLTTKAGEHLYADAVTFKVISKPRNLFYVDTEALPELFETSVENKSVIPTIGGSKEGLKFAIKSVTPTSTAFTIDETTGQISIPEGNTLEINETPYVFNITASNIYGSKDFEAVYSVKIVAYIEPIKPETFHYTAVDKLYQLGGSVENIAPDAGLVGGALTFRFDENNSEEIKAQIEQDIITISANGAISIANNHTLSAQEHEIKVKVTNKKNEDGVIAALKVTVLENPNDFEYVSWGTNMENEITINTGGNKTIPIDTSVKLENNEQYRNQFRFIHGRDAHDLEVLHVENKNSTSSSYTYQLVPNNYIGEEDIFKGITVLTDGKITFTKADNNNGNLKVGKPNAKNGTHTSTKGCIFQIKVTAQDNSGAPAVSKKIPIFISTPKAPTAVTYENVNSKAFVYTILCKPFVVRVNPKTGKSSPFTTEMHVIGAKGDETTNNIQKNYSLQQGDYTAWTSNIVWDYRDDFSYCNFDDNTTHGTGDNKSPQNLLAQVWSNCGINAVTTNTPFRYYDHATGNVDVDNNIKAAYIRPTSGGQYELIINGDVWKGNDNKYANGAMMGTMRFNLDNSTALNTATSITQYSLFIWLDETYEGN